MLLNWGEGHASHFLTRLDRINRQQTELALSLYNDVEMLMEILRRAKVPDSVERVAISLDDPHTGPFLIVTRQGRFVTCLGSGMRASNLPVVTRAQLDGFAAQWQDLRMRMEMSRKFAGSGFPPNSFLRHATDSGMNLSREEFIALSAWVEPLRGTWMDLFARLAMGLHQELPSLMKNTRITPDNETQLRASWKIAWALGNLSMLLSSETRELIEIFKEIAPPTDPDPGPRWAENTARLCASTGLQAMMLRSWYFSSVSGPRIIPRYKAATQDLVLPDELVPSFGGLTALGLRDPSLRGEVRRILAVNKSDPVDWQPFASCKDKEWERRVKTEIQGNVASLRRSAEIAFERPEEARAEHLAIGRQKVFQLTSRLRGHHPMRFPTPADVPEHLAFPMAVNDLYEARRTANIPRLGCFLPWIAQAKAEDFYLPRDFLDVIDFEFKSEWVLDWLSSERSLKAAQGLIPAPKKQTPNEFCACKSGKKYKRCCGAEGAAPPTGSVLG